MLKKGEGGGSVITVEIGPVVESGETGGRWEVGVECAASGGLRWGRSNVYKGRGGNREGGQRYGKWRGGSGGEDGGEGDRNIVGAGGIRDGA